MAAPQSYERFNYLLRPCKQVERKLFIEAMQKLVGAQYPIRDYTYIGLGSIYYADFVLFHKFLYIDKMICAELSNIPKRMGFNKPYKFITLKMEPVADVIQRMKRTRQYLVWLDYDKPLDAGVLEDLDSCIQRAGNGSIILVTVEAEARLANRVLDRNTPPHERDERLVSNYQADFGNLVKDPITKRRLGPAKLPSLFSEALRNRFDESVEARGGRKFYQLFNIRYADGAQMLTVGGIVDSDSAAKRLKGSGVYDLPFVKSNRQLVSISVPYLTQREKQWIDSKVKDGKCKTIRLFELDDDMFENYVRFYKEYPSYFETLL